MKFDFQQAMTDNMPLMTLGLSRWPRHFLDGASLPMEPSTRQWTMDLIRLLVDGVVNAVTALGLIAAIVLMTWTKGGIAIDKPVESEKCSALARDKSQSQSVNVPVSVVCSAEKPKPTKPSSPPGKKPCRE